MKIEARFEAFRTHMGEMKQGLLCQVFFINPVDKRTVNLPVFHISEFTQNVLNIDPEINHYDEAKKEFVKLNLFEDMVF